MSNSKRRILFLDRDGTLIIEPEDFQIDSLEKLELLEDVIPALLKLKAAGYEFVIVSNQDGLGTASNPLEKFQPPHDKMLSLFASQGINFVAEHIDPHFESDAAHRPNAGSTKRVARPAPFVQPTYNVVLAVIARPAWRWQPRKVFA